MECVFPKFGSRIIWSFNNKITMTKMSCRDEKEEGGEIFLDPKEMIGGKQKL
jgi:hypothetical protein